MTAARAGRAPGRSRLPILGELGLFLCLALLGVAFLAARTSAAQQFGLRDLQGKVIGADEKPINGAIVYLQSSRNNDIKTFISTQDGSYRFAALAADTDYTVWAAYKGKKSSTKTVSSFDTRKLITVDLHIR